MKIPKEMIGRRINILIPGLPVYEVKVTATEPTETVAIYQNDEEIHIDTEAIKAWWPVNRKERDPEKTKEAVKKATQTKKDRGLIK